MAEKNNTPPKKNRMSIFIPLIIIAVAAGTIAYFGFFAKSSNPINSMLSNIPVVNNLIPANREVSTVDTDDQQQNQSEKETLDNLATELQNRANELGKKENDLNIRESEITTKEAEIQALQDTLKAQYDDIKKLSSVYSKMDPKAAAESLTQLNDNNLAAQILKNMGTEQAGAILSSMQPEQAAAITSVLAPQ